MTRLLLLLVAVLAACDLPAPIEPTNPFDPENRFGRIPTAPTDLVVTATTPTSITLTWTDQSSFESGYHVVELRETVTGRVIEELVAALPPDATSHTIEDLRDVQPHRYLVRALADPNDPLRGDASVSEVVDIRYPPVTQAALPSASTTGIQAAAFSGDGETLFVRADGDSGDGLSVSVEIYDARDGRRLGEAVLPAFFLNTEDRVLRSIPGDRVATVGEDVDELAEAVGARLFTVSRAGVVETVPIDPQEQCGTFAVSADGTRVAGACSGDEGEAVYLWSATDGTLLTSLESPTFQRGISVRDIQPTRLLVQAGRVVQAMLVSDARILWESPPGPLGGGVTAQTLGDGSLAIVSPWEFSPQRSSRVEVRDVQTGAVVAAWEDRVSGIILATQGRRAVYPTDVRLGTGGTEAVVVDVEAPSERRILAGQAGNVVAAHLDEADGVVTIGRDGWLYRWDVSRSWEVVGGSVAEAR